MLKRHVTNFFCTTFQVRNGNWSEDLLAYERTQNPPKVYTNYETEYRGTISKFKAVDPVERAATARKTADLRAKVKEGFSYATLFEHGNYKDALPVSL